MQDQPEEQCKTFKPCIPSDHTTVSCEDGDVGCPEGEGTPPQPTDAPQHPCTAGITYNPAGVHWACVNEDFPNLKSPYDQDNTEMPANTLCFTTRR